MYDFFRLLIAVVALALAFQSGASAQPPCTPGFVPGLGNLGLSGRATACGVFDDGGGSALYVGNIDTVAGLAVGGVAKLQAGVWSGAGTLNQDARDFAVYDDGGGPALYMSGFFTTINGVNLRYIAKRNGAGWSQLGAGLTFTGFLFSGHITAMEVFDDGSGSALYAIGEFTLPGA